ncbi:MAG TPA: dihydroxyacetone kinase, partial [Propionibacteriaceae bacterium]|nr:dihydroxyacetone kinase [Propionibacteriaceae bacterium]HBY21898.1 dihydroxyacetone kinase [Propionibacteriaceae bacterium]
MKKLINDAADVVSESLLGVEAAHSDIVRVDHDQKVI